MLFVRVPWIRFSRNTLRIPSAIQLIINSEFAYFALHGRYADLKELGPARARLLSGEIASGNYAGFLIEVRASQSGFSVQAWPTAYKETGFASYYADSTGVIRRQWGPNRATKNSPIWPE